MKILVAGGAGFLGSNLCEKLLQDDNQVVCLDNLLTGSKENIQNLLENPNFSFIEMDVLDIKQLKDSGFSRVYHLASPASPNLNSSKSYHALAEETMQVNTNGTRKLAQLALDNQAKFLFFSTSEAYGDPLEHPQKETYRGNVSTTGPRSVYDESKRFGETIVAYFVRNQGLDGRIIRIFNTYGPKMALDDGRLVMEFVKAALEERDFPIFGDGEQTRSFCYVSDLIEGIILAMESDKTKGEIFNLGNSSEFTILDLAQIIKELTVSKSKIKFTQELPQDDPLQRQPDISKAKEVLGFEPKIELKEGLKKLIEEVKKRLG